jgi:LuxR family maltose regulon positive regulatory protein
MIIISQKMGYLSSRLPKKGEAYMRNESRLPVSLPEICAPRDKLMSLYDNVVKKQIVYVHAPSGYGKTVSTLLWLKRSNRQFAWLTLDKYDNTLSVLYRSMCRSLLALSQVSYQDDSAARQNIELNRFVVSPAFSSSPVENTIEFITMLSWGEGQYALTLDDLHSITNEEILKSLPYILKRLPPCVTVLLLSRTAPLGAISAMSDAGNDKLGLIGSHELMFTPEEIRRHFISYGLFISAERANDIFTYTDGWIIILNAMLISGNQKLSNKEVLPNLESYLEKNIWNVFDEATQTFLMKTSVVDSFTLELCELLTESPSSSETLDVLDMLIQGNINLALVGGEYRYHNLFLEFLRGKLEKSGIEQNALFESAAKYYLKTEQFFKAAAYSERTNNGHLNRDIIQMFFQSKNPALEQFLEMSQVFDLKGIPAERLTRAPILYMPNILSSFLRGDTENTKALFDRFYAALPEFMQMNHPIGDVAVTRLLLDFRVKLSELSAFMDSLKIKRDKKVPGQAAVVTVQMPMLHRGARDFYEFLDAETKEAARGMFSCLLPIDCDHFYQGITAGLLMEQNRLGEALDVALAAYGGMTGETAVEIAFGISICLAEIYSALSDKEHYQTILEQLKQHIDDSKAQYLLKNLTAYVSRLKLWDSDTNAAREWLDNYFVSESAYGEFYRIYQNFTTARAQIVLSRTGNALAILERLAKLGTEMNRPLDSAEAGVLIAIVEWAAGKKKEARDRILGVLAAMRPYSFIRVIACEGKSVLPILTAAIKKLDKEPVKDERLYRFTKEVYYAAYEQSKRFKGLTNGLQLKEVKLSPKQTQVLEFLSKGITNAEIIAITGLSINTIREHTRIIYRKLEVTNAMDAVVKARQLGILK